MQNVARREHGLFKENHIVSVSIRLNKMDMCVKLAYLLSLIRILTGRILDSQGIRLFNRTINI